MSKKRRPRKSYFGAKQQQNPVGFSATTYSSPKCSHFRQKIELQDGLHCYASASRDQPKDWRDDRDNAPGAFTPDLGIYFHTYGWEPRGMARAAITPYGMDNPFPDTEGAGTPLARPMLLVEWHDYSEPEEIWLEVAQYALEQIQAGKNVDFGCFGGHGRTGTALATILILQGVTVGLAMKNIRDQYCEEAIESQSQVDWLAKLSDDLWGYDPDQATEEESAAYNEVVSNLKGSWKTSKGSAISTGYGFTSGAGSVSTVQSVESYKSDVSAFHKEDWEWDYGWDKKLIEDAAYGEGWATLRVCGHADDGGLDCTDCMIEEMKLGNTRGGD